LSSLRKTNSKASHWSTQAVLVSMEAMQFFAKFHAFGILHCFCVNDFYQFSK